MDCKRDFNRAPRELCNCDRRYILVLEDNISNIILLKLKSLFSLILIDIVLAFPLLVWACFLNFSSSFKTYRTIADYISDISTLKP
jgi:hypothetical protein